MFNKETLSNLIKNDIKEKIINKEYLPGSQLPSEKELIEKYGVGRYTIREALKGLESQKIIEIKKGIGTFVSSLSKENFYNYPLETVVLLLNDSDKIRHMLEFRKILEVHSVKLAAERIKEDDIIELEKLLKEMEKSIEKDLEDFSRMDQKFHLMISKSTNNIFINKVLELFSTEIQYDIKKLMLIPEVQNSVIKWHQEIFSSLKNHDPDNAVKAMGNHIKSLLEFYNKQNAIEKD
jgi:GntR family transcriptional regulator, transcriptional repressor for pyruvate dehydrogenase complex